MSHTTPASAANERDLFDAWYDANVFRHEYDKYGPAEVAWSVWQAARAIPQPAAEPARFDLAALVKAAADEIINESAADTETDPAELNENSAHQAGKLAGVHVLKRLIIAATGRAPSIPATTGTCERQTNSLCNSLTGAEFSSRNGGVPQQQRTAQDRAPSAGSAADAQDAARWRYVRDTETLETAVWEALEGTDCAPGGVLDRHAYAAAMDRAVDAAIAAMPKQPT